MRRPWIFYRWSGQVYQFYRRGRPSNSLALAFYITFLCIYYLPARVMMLIAVYGSSFRGIFIARFHKVSFGRWWAFSSWTNDTWPCLFIHSLLSCVSGRASSLSTTGTGPLSFLSGQQTDQKETLHLIRRLGKGSLNLIFSVCVPSYDGHCCPFFFWKMRHMVTVTTFIDLLIFFPIPSCL
ncbi:hypothetical protein B0F90DRAFT_1399995 [Multifurca ochricompacta]|uniref:Uncharacterized protein n=1 Tax=Multifurca ochricompacta TaxID=376703 RepID=A0AAD4LXM0_9AGAM|nr:hypothetical protein B0F90DRAFT_1399995 [Multifurca ochricompacta]